MANRKPNRSIEEREALLEEKKAWHYTMIAAIDEQIKRLHEPRKHRVGTTKKAVQDEINNSGLTNEELLEAIKIAQEKKSSAA